MLRRILNMRKDSLKSLNNSMFTCESGATDNGAVENMVAENGAIFESVPACEDKLPGRHLDVFNGGFACKKDNRHFECIQNPETMTRLGFSRLKPSSTFDFTLYLAYYCNCISIFLSPLAGCGIALEDISLPISRGKRNLVRHV